MEYVVLSRHASIPTLEEVRAVIGAIGGTKIGGTLIDGSLRAALAHGESRGTLTAWLTPGGFDAPAVASGEAPHDTTRERLRSARLAAHIHVDLRAGVEKEDAMWCVAITDAMATMLEGVVLDPSAQRLWDPAEWSARVHDQPFRADLHVFVQTLGPDANGRFVMRTRGLDAFARPELAVPSVAEANVGTAAWLLTALAEHTIGGPLLEPRHRATFAGAKVGLISREELCEVLGARLSDDHPAKGDELANALFVVDCEAADTGAPDVNDALLAHLKANVN